MAYKCSFIYLWREIEFVGVEGAAGSSEWGGAEESQRMLATSGARINSPS